jgi:adenosylhomocysteine nucleosidase
MTPALTLVFFAVAAEARPFRRRRPTHTPVRVCLCGIGQTNARRIAVRELAGTRPGMVLTCGFAGGLNPALAHAQVLVESEPDFPLLPRLRAAGAVPGRFYCADRILITPQEKAAVWLLTRADAVEMESGAIHEACAQAGVPCATVRAISDPADQALPLDFNRLASTQWRLSYLRLVLALAPNPTKVLALRRFQKGLNLAAARLADVLGAALS